MCILDYSQHMIPNATMIKNQTTFNNFPNYTKSEICIRKYKKKFSELSLER